MTAAYKFVWLSLVVLAIDGCQSRREAVHVGAPTDPLPNWNDGNVKASIIKYVTQTTKEGSPQFIPPDDRIATFDNDGTLWAERPYVQELFAIARAKKMVKENPKLANQQPFKAAVDGDREYFTKNGSRILSLLIATHTGMSEEEFEESTREFFHTAKYPGRDVPIRQIRYQPQLELLEYLRANDFKVYICTGGTVEFVRSISKDFYGIEPERVIGTSFQYAYADSTGEIYREPTVGHFNDKAGKPVAIQLHIGKKPVFACGNEGGSGDIVMLTFSQTSRYPSFQLLVNHDDAEREFYYGEPDSASLKAAARGRWNVVSIKSDWKEVYARQ